MADKKITELTEATQLQDNDIFQSFKIPKLKELQ